MQLIKRIIPGSPKMLYIENLRIFLSALVVAVHVACTYGGPGGWIYIEEGAGLGTILPLTILNATSQSFFMGMFFLIGAYFTHRSFQRKGCLLFIKDRIIRLGIPLVIYYFFISTLTAYIVWPVKYPDFSIESYGKLFMSGYAFSFGVMWFVLALSYFTIIYLFARLIIPSSRKEKKKELPVIKWQYILFSSIALGLITYFVRIKFPLFTKHYDFLPFDLGHFPQYIFLFILGIAASKYQSDQFVTYYQAKKWLLYAIFMVVGVFPLLFYIAKAQNGITPFAGRGTWQSLAYAIWEQVTGIAIIVTLLGTSKMKWNHQSRFVQKLSGSAYGVYVFHPPIIVAISVFFMNWKIMPLLKFMFIAPISIFTCFAIALIIKQIPVLKKIF